MSNENKWDSVRFSEKKNHRNSDKISRAAFQTIELVRLYIQTFVAYHKVAIACIAYHVLVSDGWLVGCCIRKHFTYGEMVLR